MRPAQGRERPRRPGRRQSIEGIEYHERRRRTIDRVIDAALLAARTEAAVAASAVSADRVVAARDAGGHQSLVQAVVTLSASPVRSATGGNFAIISEPSEYVQGFGGEYGCGETPVTVVDPPAYVQVARG